MSRFFPAASCAVLAATLGACATSAPRPQWKDPLVGSVTDGIDAVVFLVGDAGNSRPGQNPVLTRLTQDVEQWSRRLARDSAVSVLFLGDNVYPEGVRDRDDPSFVEDSLHLLSQVQVVAGEDARRYRTWGYFLAGNHDWGQMDGLEGLLRLRNQEALLRSFREEGIRVDLVPDAGRPGPRTLDIGRTVRFLAFDTHWWLQAREDPREDSVLLRVAEGIRTAGHRHVALAAHHPFVSGGSHGGPMPIWRGFGILWLLRKTGSLVQDINSLPYRELLNGLRAVFAAEGAPLLFAGGHDHSLQVIEGGDEDEPRWSVVSGAGSKLTDVGPAPGMRWGMDRPGFMRLIYMNDGAVYLHVYLTGDEFLTCAPEEVGDVEACMEAALEEFHLAYAVTLRQAGAID